MKRKILFCGLSLLVLAIILGTACATQPTPTPTPAPSPTPQTSIEPIDLKFADWSPPGVSINVAVEDYFKEVSAATGGKIKLTGYYAAALGPPPQQYDMVTSGIADVAMYTTVFAPGRFPLSDIFGVPYMWTSVRQGTWVMNDIYTEHLAQEYKEVKMLGLFAASFNQVWTTKPVKALADLKGKKLAVAGAVPSSIVTALGATPVNIGSNDRYDAIQKGVVEGVVWNSESITSRKLNEVVKYGAFSDIYSNLFMLIMNNETWDKLPQDVKDEINKSIGFNIGVRISDAFDRGEIDAVKQLTDMGLVLYTLPPEEKAKWAAAAMPVTQKVIADLEAKGLPGQATYDAMQQSIKNYKP